MASPVNGQLAALGYAFVAGQSGDPSDLVLRQTRDPSKGFEWKGQDNCMRWLSLHCFSAQCQCVGWEVGRAGDVTSGAHGVVADPRVSIHRRRGRHGSHCLGRACAWHRRRPQAGQGRSGHGMGVASWGWALERPDNPTASPCLRLDARRQLWDLGPFALHQRHHARGRDVRLHSAGPRPRLDRDRR